MCVLYICVWELSRKCLLSFSENTLYHSISKANFVGFVVGFLNVLVIRLRSLLLAASLSFDRVRNHRARNRINFYPTGKWRLAGGIFQSNGINFFAELMQLWCCQK